MKTRRKFVVLSLIIVLVSGFSAVKTPKVYAVEIAGCELLPWEFAPCLFKKAKDSLPDLDIRRTVLSAVTAMLTDVPTQLVFNRTMDELKGCAAKAIEDQTTGIAGYGNFASIVGLPDTVERIDCADLEGFNTAMNVTPNSSVAAGGLMGVTILAQQIVDSEAIPVNLAYYFNDVKSNLPFVNKTAYAAEYNPSAWGLNYVLKVWKETRNIAYGLLSIAMLVIGIMIMARKKVNPQAVVTIENALPRVILAVILITFSYAIGALAASMVSPLKDIPNSIFTRLNANLFANIAPTLLLVEFVAILINLTGVGVFVMLGFIIFLIIYFSLWLFALIKIIFIYIRIVISIVAAPLIFAWGAVPGNEGATSNWFKTLAANLLAIPAMFFVIHFSWHILRVSLNAMATGVGNVATPWDGIGPIGSTMLIFFATPAMMLLIMLFALKIPGKIHDAILDVKKKR